MIFQLCFASNSKAKGDYAKKHLKGYSKYTIWEENGLLFIDIRSVKDLAELTKIEDCDVIFNEEGITIYDDYIE